MPEQLLSLLYPDLSRFAARERSQALAKAREGRFDLVELVGLAVALVMTVVLTRYAGAEMNLSERLGAVLLNFVVAIPLLFVLGGPFCLRRTRRHLRAQLHDQAAARGERHR